MPDDIAVVARGPVTSKVGELLQETAETIIDWLAGKEIELALEKTELILPTWKRVHNTLEICVMGQPTISRPEIKYLGLQLDRRINFGVHASTYRRRRTRQQNRYAL